ncbi:LytTR family DNA-binding domain-containing protein [Aneurinibacillus sp. Ricciae_BoGa-3]|uniref:LytR/AlgR family response regulator transcription factor n=1 Tax=Aneurinibacillus sp. Ricciae_BoGa-3 TaxID=3022697 RepID=UPI002341B5CD|nr:LytTR family DNA-binding domain-containing protein [Aneurinibacillus sp. Ricciae_BoGa-3]WCK54474.1 LytTR family DNA-binding domain-containing protein [Aneurinibacillus sp. Ricciae_BoGa-3]
MAWRVLVVDDEHLAREELVYMLGQIPKFEVVGTAATGMDAIKKTKELKPEFVFLDIQLPDLTGLQAAELIRELGLDVKIVFITAYDQYAVEAFKLRAFHYLLKPYDREDLERVVLSYSQEVKRENPHDKRDRLPQNADYKPRLAIEIDSDIKYLSPEEIVYIDKEGRKVRVHTEKEQFDAQYTLQELEGKLKPFSFFRTHKSYLVNLKFIKELHPWFNGSYNVYMNDAHKSIVPVSRNYVKDLRSRLEL